MAEATKQKHFVLVHGTNHGAWIWYKLKPLLEAAGHRVTAFDLAASGIKMEAIQDVHTFYEYTEPLLKILASLPPDEKVILVGHSLGGMNLALAMDKFPEKISVAVFLTAFMPDTAHPPSYILDEGLKMTPKDDLMDTEVSPFKMVLGPEYLKFKIYQLSPPEDLELGKMLIRPGSLFLEDLSNSKNYSNEGYGSVTRVYIVCDEDKAIPKEFQHWMIENYPVKEVMKIKGADHMAMFSKEKELCDCLSEIANKYA